PGAQAPPPGQTADPKPATGPPTNYPHPAPAESVHPVPGLGSARPARCGLSVRRFGPPAAASDNARPPHGSTPARHGSHGTAHARGDSATGWPCPERLSLRPTPRMPAPDGRTTAPDWYGYRFRSPWRLRSALGLAPVVDHPVLAVVERAPAAGLAFDLALYVLFLALAAVANHRRVAIGVRDRRVKQEVILGVDCLAMGQQLLDQGRTGFPVLRKLAGSQEQSRGTITQHIDVVDFLAAQLRHQYRVHFRRRRLAALQQFAGVLAGTVGTAEVLAEAAGLELHFTAAFVAFDHRTIIALDLELALFHLEAAAIGVVAAHVQLAM